MVGAYKRSKFLAEQEVQRLIRRHNLPAVIVNPSTPIGPRDIKPTPTGRVIVEAVKGKIPAYVDTGLNIAHVDDVAMGHLARFRARRMGERYILGGENMGFGEILRIDCGRSRRKPPTLQLPRACAFSDRLCRRSACPPHRQGAVCHADALRMAKKKMFFSSAKAQRELGYSARPATMQSPTLSDGSRRTGIVK